MQHNLPQLPLLTFVNLFKSSWLILSLALVFLLTLTGCSYTPDSVVPIQSGTDNIENTFTQCPASTSNNTMCTMQYEPVCVKTQTGSMISYRTAGNACSACNLPEAIGYTEGECK